MRRVQEEEGCRFLHDTSNNSDRCSLIPRAWRLGSFSGASSRLVASSRPSMKGIKSGAIFSICLLKQLTQLIFLLLRTPPHSKLSTTRSPTQTCSLSHRLCPRSCSPRLSRARCRRTDRRAADRRRPRASATPATFSAATAPRP